DKLVTGVQTCALPILLLILLLALMAVALRVVIVSPFRALGILVAGMAVHNFLLMVLLRLGTPDLLVRLLQAWKEAILLALVGVRSEERRVGKECGSGG